MRSHALPGPAHAAHSAPDRQALAALWVVPVFVAWTAAFILLSPFVADVLGADVKAGEVVYLESWLAWSVAELLWVAPVVVGVVLAARARARGGRLALLALLVNTALLVLVVGPPLADRLLNL